LQEYFSLPGPTQAEKDKNRGDAVFRATSGDEAGTPYDENAGGHAPKWKDSGAANRVIRSFFPPPAKATDRELARVVESLNVENRILRDKPPRRLTVTPRERQGLVKRGKAPGSAINGLLTSRQ